MSAQHDAGDRDDRSGATSGETDGQDTSRQSRRQPNGRDDRTPDNTASDGPDSDDGDGDGDGDGEGESLTPEEARILRTEVRDLRTKLRDANAEAKKHRIENGKLKNSGKSEAETAQSERDEALDELKRIREDLHVERSKSAALSLAEKAGANNPQTIYRLIAGKIVFDDDGHPENIDELIAKEKREDPDAFRKRVPSGDQPRNRGNDAGGGQGDASGRGRTPRRQSSVNDTFRRKADERRGRV